MKRLMTGILAGAALCGLALAQDTTPPQNTEPKSQQNPAQPAQSAEGQASGPRIAPGSVIPVQLTKTVDAKKVKTGDPVEAKVTQDLKTGNGQVLVPKDTKVVGHVTEVQPRTKEQKESQLGIAFDRAVMKNGGDVPLPMSIQAIIAPSAVNPGNNENGGGGAPSASAPSAGGMSPGNNGRSSGMGSGTPPAQPSGEAGGYAPPSGSNANAHPPITGETQGVVGISNLTLSPGTAQGSVVTSDKNNVKLENGTLMLLRVNQ